MGMVGQYSRGGNIGTFLNNAPKTQYTPPGGKKNGLLDNVIGLGESMYGQKIQDDRVNQIQGDWRNTLAAAQPGNVTGTDVETFFDPETQTVKQKLSGRREGMLSGLYAGVDNMGNQIGQMNPYEYADYMYNQASGARNLAQDREKAQVLEMMNARGIDVSDIGNNLYGATVQSQNFANTAERAGYIAQGQDMENSKVANYNALINSIYGSDAVNSQGIADAVSLGTNVPPPEYLNTAYQDAGDAKAEKGSALGDLLGMGANMLLPGSGGFVSGLFS